MSEDDKSDKKEVEQPTQPQSRVADLGCFALFLFFVLGLSVFITRGLALNLVQILAPTWPIWIDYLVGGLCVLGAFGLLLIVCGDLMDVLVGLLVAVFFVAFLLPMFKRAHDNAVHAQKAHIRAPRSGH